MSANELPVSCRDVGELFIALVKQTVLLRPPCYKRQPSLLNVCRILPLSGCVNGGRGGAARILSAEIEGDCLPKCVLGGEKPIYTRDNIFPQLRTDFQVL